MTYENFIKELQSEMNRDGAGLTVDGDPGPKTKAALEHFDFVKLELIPKPPTLPPPTDKFSVRSLKNLSECHPDLQRLAYEMRKEIDIEIICGHRGEKEQNEAYARGYSKLKWPNSKHNKTPSLAFDACPNPIDWDDNAGFHRMRSIAVVCAEKLKIKIRLLSWDLPHIELA